MKLDCRWWFKVQRINNLWYWVPHEPICRPRMLNFAIIKLGKTSTKLKFLNLWQQWKSRGKSDWTFVRQVNWVVVRKKPTIILYWHTKPQAWTTVSRWWIPSSMLSAIELLSSFVDLVQKELSALALSSTCRVRYSRGGTSSLCLLAWLLIGKLRVGTAPVRRVCLVSSENKLPKLQKKHISIQNLKSTAVKKYVCTCVLHWLSPKRLFKATNSIIVKKKKPTLRTLKIFAKIF